MRASRFVTSLGVAAGLISLVAVTAAVAQSGPTAVSAPTSAQGPVATASGGSAVTLVYPSVVAVHLDRSEAAIARAETAVDSAANGGGAADEMSTATAQMIEAWQATRYVIRKTPPPPPPGDRAGASGDAATGPSFASPPETSLAVFSLQHDLVAAAAGLLGSNATLNSALTATMGKTATRRVAAINYIHKVAPPLPPGDRAGASGAPVTVTFDAIMPGVLPLLDDEIQALRGTLALNKSLPDDVKSAVRAVIATDKKAQTMINTFWPPVVGDG